MAPNRQVPVPDIPSEIIFNILSNFPIKLLCRFRSVSKPWMAMANHHIETRLGDKSEKLIIASNTYPCSFYSLHPRSSNEKVEIKTFSECWFDILGSCNGVLLLRSSYDSSLYFWNPFTRRHRLIPSPGRPRETVIQGLGYDSFTDDFKVIWVIRGTQDLEDSPSRAYVYSSVSNLWKRINNFLYNRCSGTTATSGVIYNGSPHWIVGRVRQGRFIVYFDPYEETFHELSVPVQGCRLVVLGGNLCGVQNNNDYSIEVWVMKDSTWSMFFVVPRWQGEFSPRLLTPLFILGDGHDLSCEVVGIQLNTRALVLYNIIENKFERIELPLDCERFGAACFYGDSGFSLTIIGGDRIVLGKWILFVLFTNVILLN